ncbi:unnamed protein product [Moneuplotes crassus]|uniref:Uncharacterized protein n=2 Tax=Euplotes crassus TaxID=5936 RepID=A0AAD2D5R4_EUPCR|nr:unnamed protein product [Moneuplotes crassus]
MSINISPNDDREYKFFKLENEMRVIVISDKEATKCSACMQVEAGSALNPKEYQGLAHFLEHMLFMGTEKYPEEESYSKHCADSGGYDNAYTGLEQTNYHFEVSTEGFEKALDMFAQFFICPLFSKDAVDREMNAVDSENQKNLQSDMWRFFQILLSESNEESVLNCFPTGNLKTLKKDGVVEALHAFHKKWYSSNIMNLTVYSSKSIEEMETLVTELFSGVENKNVTVPSFAEPAGYPKEFLGKLYKIKPVMDEHQLKFLWFYPKCYNKDHYDRVFNLLSHVIGHEGENSLLSYLIEDDLATSCYAYCDHEISSFTYMCLNLTLTDKGFENYERVIEIVTKMCQVLASEGPIDHVFEECSKNGDLKWKFLDKSSPINTTVSMADRMHLFTDENIQDILQTRYTFANFNKEEYQNILNGLLPDNMNVYLSSKKVDTIVDTPYNVEEWYGTEFVKEKFSEDLLQRLKNPTADPLENSKLSNPIENTLFPKSLDLCEESKDSTELTVQNVSDENIDIWYKKSEKFKTPKINAFNLLYTNDCGFQTSLQGAVFSTIWLKVIQDYFREFLYMADMASLECQTSESEGSIRIDFRGYSDPMQEFVEKFFDKLKSFDARKNKQTFDSKKEELLKQWANFALVQPYSQVFGLARSVMFLGQFPPKEKLEHLKDFTFEKFCSLSEEFLTNARSVWFFNGDLTKDQAVSTAQKATETLAFKTIPKDLLVFTRPLMMDENSETNIVIDAENKDETNSAILSIYQDETRFDTVEEEFAHHMIHSVVFQILDNPSFDYLRTKEQLGYIAYARSLIYREMIGGGFIIQSAVKNPEYLIKKSNDFLEMYKEKLASLSDEDFETAVKAVIMDKKEVDHSLLKESIRLFTRVEKHSYDFDYKEKQIEYLEKMMDKSNEEFYTESKKKVVDHFNHLFYGPEGSGPRVAHIELIASQHKEDNTTQYEANKEAYKRAKRRVVDITEISRFKNSSVVYPDKLLNRFSNYSTE